MPILGAGIGVVGNLVSGLIGSSAASKAAKIQAEAGAATAGAIDNSSKNAVAAGYAGIDQSNTAINSGTAAATGAISNAGAAQQGIYGNETGTLQPYQSAGLQGLNALQSTSGRFSFNPTDLTNDPGYQFQLSEGMKALNNSAATRGMLQSGANLKANMGYAQGLAGTSYQNAYNRALSTYNTNQQGFQTLAGLGQNANAQNLQAGSTYGGQLTSLAGLGANTDMQGAGMLANTATQGNQWIGQTGLAGAEAAGNARMGAANASAAGIMGSANAWGSALSGIGSAAQSYGLSQMAPGATPTQYGTWATPPAAPTHP